MKIMIVVMAALLMGCAQRPVTYHKAADLTPQQMDEAACDVEASKLRHPLFPNNPILNGRVYREGFDNCMMARGYRADR